jgi:hypothetical protein
MEVKYELDDISVSNFRIQPIKVFTTQTIERKTTLEETERRRSQAVSDKELAEKKIAECDAEIAKIKKVLKVKQ